MVTTSHPAEWAEYFGGPRRAESELVKCECGFWTYRSLHPHGVRIREGKLVDCMGREVSRPKSASGVHVPHTPQPPGETP